METVKRHFIFINIRKPIKNRTNQNLIMNGEGDPSLRILRIRLIDCTQGRILWGGGSRIQAPLQFNFFCHAILRLYL